jgi:hypothetical protein
MFTRTRIKYPYSTHEFFHLRNFCNLSCHQYGVSGSKFARRPCIKTGLKKKKKRNVCPVWPDRSTYCVIISFPYLNFHTIYNNPKNRDRCGLMYISFVVPRKWQLGVFCARLMDCRTSSRAQILNY